MFVRICPYLPFSARICLNQHHWLANRLRENGIGFKQLANAFLNKFAQRGALGSELIGHDGGWSDALLLQKFSHQL
jgi:hypothetical protein